MSDPRPSANPLFLREEELRQAIEMLFFAYRDFTGEADAMLVKHGFGRAHHRVIYFVGRQPMISVSDLLGILKITKQSLSRVLGQLVRDGFIVQHRGPADGRQRLLELTDEGKAIEQQLTEAQRQRIASAYRRAGGDAVQGFRAVLLGIMDSSVRSRFLGSDTDADKAPR